MAAPTVTVRLTPSGIYLQDGHGGGAFGSKIAFSEDPDVSLWEMEPSLPGIDGGEPVNTTTMWNVLWRTMQSRALKTMTPFDCRCAYDPAVYTQLNTLINKRTGSVTNSLPDGSTISYWGYLQKIAFDSLKEGEMPTCTITIVPTNFDPGNKVEAGPLVVEVAGT